MCLVTLELRRFCVKSLFAPLLPSFNRLKEIPLIAVDHLISLLRFISLETGPALVLFILLSLPLSHSSAALLIRFTYPLHFSFWHGSFFSVLLENFSGIWMVFSPSLKITKVKVQRLSQHLSREHNSKIQNHYAECIIKGYFLYQNLFNSLYLPVCL